MTGTLIVLMIGAIAIITVLGTMYFMRDAPTTASRFGLGGVLLIVFILISWGCFTQMKRVEENTNNKIQAILEQETTINNCECNQPEDESEHQDSQINFCPNCGIELKIGE